MWFIWLCGFIAMDQLTSKKNVFYSNVSSRKPVIIKKENIGSLIRSPRSETKQVNKN